MRRIRVALAQVNPTVGALEANARLVIDGMDRARALGCRHRGLPRAGAHRLPARGPPVQAGLHRGQPARRSRDVAAASRGPHVRGRLRGPDARTSATPPPCSTTARIAGTYHKQLPARTTACSTRTATSSAGTESPVFALGDAIVAVNICEDIWYPTGPTVGQALAGAELVVSASTPRRTTRARRDDREQMLATRAARRPSCAWPSSTWWAGRTSWSSTASRSSSTSAASASRGAAPSRRIWWWPTSTSTRSSARACTTRGGARSSSAPGRSPAAHRAARAPPAAEARAARRARRAAPDRLAEIYQALVLGTRDYVTEERLPPRRHRPLRRHRLRPGRGHRRRRPRRRATSPASPCRRRTPRRARAATRRGSPGASASGSCSCRSRACSRRYGRALAAPFKGLSPGRHRGEPPGAHPRQHPHGALEQVRLARPHHRQQERDRRRLLHPLRRHGRRLRGDQGRAEDAGLRARRATQRPGRPRGSSRARSSTARPPPSCGPTRPTRTRCRRTTCSTPSSRPTWRTTAASPRSSPAGFDERHRAPRRRAWSTATSTSAARAPRHQDHPARLRPGLAPAHRQPVPRVKGSSPDDS